MVGPDRFVFVFTDPDDTSQGFFTIPMLPVDVDTRRMLLMFSKFFSFRPASAGHAANHWKTADVMPARIAGGPPAAAVDPDRGAGRATR
ncbi:hypothetical protein [Euzebya rosea]|uniref:hypothetical protein n=1 Tax=Euzebya rosea TaxID=2052804 RepID=UPI000D3E5BE4|nr:hypothetical protein [Euzebya rosea]